MQMDSDAFQPGARIPVDHTCDGRDLSPALSWSDAPEGTKSFALIMDDPDAPPGTWVHWVIYDIPASAAGLDGSLPRSETLPDGSKHGVCWGVSRFDRVGYYGPCPPPGKPHHYSFRIYALDRPTGLPPRATRDEILAAMEGHVLAQAEVVGLYGR